MLQERGIHIFYYRALTSFITPSSRLCRDHKLNLHISALRLLITDQKLYRPTKISTDISMDYRPTLDRYIERLSSDYRPSVERPSTEPITDRYIGQVSTNYRQSVGEREAISTETHLERLSTVSRPSVDRLSTEYRSSVDRYIDRYFGRHYP